MMAAKRCKWWSAFRRDRDERGRRVTKSTSRRRGVKREFWPVVVCYCSCMESAISEDISSRTPCTDFYVERYLRRFAKNSFRASIRRSPHHFFSSLIVPVPGTGTRKKEEKTTEPFRVPPPINARWDVWTRTVDTPLFSHKLFIEAYSTDSNSIQHGAQHSTIWQPTFCCSCGGQQDSLRFVGMWNGKKIILPSARVSMLFLFVLWKSRIAWNYTGNPIISY